MQKDKLTRDQKIALHEHLGEVSGADHAPPPWVARNPKNPRQIYAEQRVPPNEKCPCGSGKKFKRCCMYKS